MASHVLWMPFEANLARFFNSFMWAEGNNGHSLADFLEDIPREEVLEDQPLAFFALYAAFSLYRLFGRSQI